MASGSRLNFPCRKTKRVPSEPLPSSNCAPNLRTNGPFLQFFQHAHVAENGHVAGQERFTDVEAREKFFFEDEHAFARAREKSGGAAAAGAATNHECVINVLFTPPVWGCEG
jgi:hypothetical protein